ncbi:glutathione peroxidase [Lacticaseibacillus daqingensis]|uniref:glutathione peroxidase n=1 Tax=Lacticaseibacillus daqingensis TaxID=2486014 RepID=UPI000F78A3EB|nr:glutathione peroxidase [Lacticaseibacillus daqingensis]
MSTIYDFTVTREDGSTVPMRTYQGHPLLIVNTATKCGLAPQFAALETLYQDYQARGFIVLGFPSAQFHQELANGAEAATACRTTWGVTFPMHALIAVNGPQTAPLFAYLKQAAPGAVGDAIKWNFTKFLVDRTGHVVSRSAPTTDPLTLRPAIEALLA